MISLYIMSLALLIAGGLLCYRGIKVYKIAQMIMCGAIGGYLGIALVNGSGRQEFYILGLVFTVLGGFLGYKYYKYSLYISVMLSSFFVAFSYFWKQAAEKVENSMYEIVSTKNAIVENMTGVKGLQETLDAFDAIRGIHNDNWALIIKESGDIIKSGFMISLAIALVAGALTRLIGDYVIMAVSSAFGAMMLVIMLEMYMTISPMLHLLLLVVIGLSGIMVQYKK